MRESSILIVDDDRLQAETLRRVLALEGFLATSVGSPAEALDEIAMRRPDAIISDFRMPGMNGLEFYHAVRADHGDILFILVTAFGSLETAVEALRGGVHDFVTKPVDMDELIIKLRKALDYHELAHENVELKQRIAAMGEGVNLIGDSPAMSRVLEAIERVAVSAATVLVQGESGTGKELIARSLHQKSPRGAGAYVKVNCAAIPENLLEDELFGHVEGAFTGAVRERKGKFEAADGGSIFLDEIGEMPLHLQTKFLRVLQEREIEPVGGNETREVDVRVIAATNRDLAAMVREGEFREDLFYRLNVIPIHIPPLRERMDDIPALARHFLAGFCAKNGRDLEDLDEDVTRRLLSYSWPGNVRELENCIERAVVLARGSRLEPGDIALAEEEPRGGLATVLEQLLATDLTLDEMERRLISGALERCDGNISMTARKLGLTRRALQYRVEKMRNEDLPDGRSGDGT